MTEYSNTEDLEAFVRNPDGRRYWTKSRRDVICRIFRQELLDKTLTLPLDKITAAMDELGEDKSRRMRARIRAFVYRFRKDRLQVLETGEVQPAPKRRKLKKGLVEAVAPLPNSSGNALDDTATDPLMLPSSDNEFDTENANKSECQHGKKEANSNSDVQPLNESNVSDTLECDKGETTSDPVDLSVNKKPLYVENNNEAFFSPAKKMTCALEMISVIKSHFAEELSSSYLLSETLKVDFVTNFLKSKGFKNITRENVYTWAEAFSRRGLDHNPPPLFNDLTNCLVRGVIDGDIDLKFILESSYTTSAETSFEELNHTKEIHIEASSSVFSGEGCDVDDLRNLDLSPIKKNVDNQMPCKNEPAAVLQLKQVVDKPMSSQNEGTEVNKMNLRKRRSTSL